MTRRGLLKSLAAVGAATLLPFRSRAERLDRSPVIYGSIEDANGHAWKARVTMVCPYVCARCGALSGTHEAVSLCKQSGAKSLKPQVTPATADTTRQVRAC